MKKIWNPKYVVFALIGIMTAYVLFHNERFLLDSSSPVWKRFEPFKWVMLVHGIAGSFVLFLAPFQFSDRLRQRFPGFHRVAGRLYVIGALVLAPLGAYIQYFEERFGAPRSFTILAIVDAAMLMGTTLLGLLFAVRRRITQHRQWMTRSYAVALVFILARVALGLTGAETMGVEMIQAVIWTCLALSVLLGDLAIHWTEIRNAVFAPVKTAVPTKPKVTTGSLKAA